MLKVINLSTYYGAIRALNSVSLHVDEGEIVTLIGANGAGKTTILRTIAGLTRPKEGRILLYDKNISTLSPARIVSRGISLVPEDRELFGDMTVQDNLFMGAYQRGKRQKDLKDDFDNIFSIFPVLSERRNQRAKTLSGGEQQMLAIGRALMAQPKLLLLDEPSTGLAPLLVKEIFSKIIQLRQSGATILLIEQNAKMALDIADRGYVLENGKITLQGTRDELAENEKVKRAYLGG
jgi:branched-chain amino acid transport system ATP-binding protein